MSQENFEFIEISDIKPNPDNPRVINEKSESFGLLIDSIKASGVLIPVHVRPDPREEGKYALLAGTRRLMACQAAERTAIPAIVHKDITDVQAFEITFNENFAREDLTVFEESKAVEILTEKYGGDIHAVSSKMGKSVSWVMQRAAINKKLSKEWKQAMVEAGEDSESKMDQWTAAHLQLIARFPDETQNELLEIYLYEAVPSVKELNEEITSKMRLLKNAPWNTDERMAVTRGGKKLKLACTICPQRSSSQPGLFDDFTDTEEIRKKDKCLNPACWDMKAKTFLKFKAAELRNQHKDLVCVSTDILSYYESQKLREDFGGFLVAGSGYAKSKEGAKGAVPALVIHGEGAGEMQWVKAVKQSSGSGRQASQKNAEKSQKSLKEKQKELASKRWQQVLRELYKLVHLSEVNMITSEDKVLFIMTAASVFGTKGIWNRNADWGSFDKFYKETESLQNYTEVCKALWDVVKPVLADRVCYNGPITQVPDHYIAEARIVAGHLGIDIDAMFAKQVEAIPEPKAWEKIKQEPAEDTTPKIKKSKKAGKTKKVVKKTTKE